MPSSTITATSNPAAASSSVLPPPLPHQSGSSKRRQAQSSAQPSSSSSSPSSDVEEKFEWFGPVLKEEKGLAYYRSVDISTIHGDYRFSVGDTVFFHTDGPQPPFVAEIQQLYEKKSTGEKFVQPRWFYRPSDVKQLTPHVLNSIDYDERLDVFLSTDSDINHVQSILRPCNILFLNTDEPMPDVNRGTKDFFVCRYQYFPKGTPSSNGASCMQKLKKADLMSGSLRFQTHHHAAATNSGKGGQGNNAGSRGITVGAAPTSSNNSHKKKGNSADVGSVVPKQSAPVGVVAAGASSSSSTFDNFGRPGEGEKRRVSKRLRGAEDESSRDEEEGDEEEEEEDHSEKKGGSSSRNNHQQKNNHSIERHEDHLKQPRRRDGDDRRSRDQSVALTVGGRGSNHKKAQEEGEQGLFEEKMNTGRSSSSSSPLSTISSSMEPKKKKSKTTDKNESVVGGGENGRVDDDGSILSTTPKRPRTSNSTSITSGNGDETVEAGSINTGRSSSSSSGLSGMVGTSSLVLEKSSSRRPLPTVDVEVVAAIGKSRELKSLVGHGGISHTTKGSDRGGDTTAALAKISGRKGVEHEESVVRTTTNNPSRSPSTNSMVPRASAMLVSKRSPPPGSKQMMMENRDDEHEQGGRRNNEKVRVKANRTREEVSNAGDSFARRRLGSGDSTDTEHEDVEDGVLPSTSSLGTFGKKSTEIIRRSPSPSEETKTTMNNDGLDIAEQSPVVDKRRGDSLSPLVKRSAATATSKKSNGTKRISPRTIPEDTVDPSIALSNREDEDRLAAGENGILGASGEYETKEHVSSVKDRTGAPLQPSLETSANNQNDGENGVDNINSRPPGDEDDVQFSFDKEEYYRRGHTYFTRGGISGADEGGTGQSRSSKPVRIGGGFQADIPDFNAAEATIQAQLVAERRQFLTSNSPDICDAIADLDKNDDLAWSFEKIKHIDDSTMQMYICAAFACIASHKRNRIAFRAATEPALLTGSNQSATTGDTSKNLLKPRVDGSLLLVRSCYLEHIFDLLHDCDYIFEDAIKKLKDPETSNQFLMEWSHDEQEKFNSAFAKYGDNMAKICSALGEGKTLSETIEYYFRCVYPAVQLETFDLEEIIDKSNTDAEKNNNPATTSSSTSSSSSSSSRKKTGGDDEGASNKQSISKTGNAGKSQKNGNPPCAEAGPQLGGGASSADGGGCSDDEGATVVKKTPREEVELQHQLTALGFLTRARDTMDEISFAQLLNAILEFKRSVLSPAGLVVRIHGICEEAAQLAAAKAVRTTLFPLQNIDSSIDSYPESDIVAFTSYLKSGSSSPLSSTASSSAEQQESVDGDGRSCKTDAAQLFARRSKEISTELFNGFVHFLPDSVRRVVQRTTAASSTGTGAPPPFHAAFSVPSSSSSSAATPSASAASASLGGQPLQCVGTTVAAPSLIAIHQR